MGSISCHITPLVIVSLRGKHINTYCGHDQFLETRHGLPIAPGLKTRIVLIIGSQKRTFRSSEFIERLQKQKKMQNDDSNQ